LYFYYCRSLAAALNACGEAAALPSEQNWRNELLEELLKRQRPNGSWQNEAVDVRENDPLVATSLAVIALTATRHDNR
jgi:disulfide oxidoreductase YuzD